MKEKPIWIILAGGRASRMEGQDKGLMPLNGSPLIEHVQKKLLSQGARIAINANRNQAHYQRYAEVFSDNNQDYHGPLAGMQAAMQQFTAQWLGFVPCDTPNLPDDLLEKMYLSIKPDSEILVAHDGQSIQPTFCMLHTSLLPKIAHFLASGERKLRLFHSQCQTQYIDFSHQPTAFINLNTPNELKAYEKLMRAPT